MIIPFVSTAVLLTAVVAAQSSITGERPCTKGNCLSGSVDTIAGPVTGDIGTSQPGWAAVSTPGTPLLIARTTDDYNSFTTASDDDGSNRNALIAHAVVGALATMLVLPLGTLVPRFARGLTTKRWWFPVHSAVNGIIGFGLVIVAFGIARSNFEREEGLDTAHRKLGMGLLILMVIQVILGSVAHWVKRSIKSLQASSGRGPTHFLHMGLGVITVVVGWVTVWFGIDDWAVESSTGPVGNGYKIGWGIVIGLTSALYVVGLVFLLPKQLRMERQRREDATGHHIAMTNATR